MKKASKIALIILLVVGTLTANELALAQDPPAAPPTGVVVPTPTGGVAGGITINGTTAIGRYEPLPGGSSINVNVTTPSGTQVGASTQTVNGQPTYVGGSVGWSF